MAEEIPHELRNAASRFVREHLPFLDRSWRYEVLERLLAELFHTTVKAHTSQTSNTALRDACLATVELVDHVRTYLPSSAKKCICRELDSGEHAPQPLCHYCTLGSIKARAQRALETP